MRYVIEFWSKKPSAAKVFVEDLSGAADYLGRLAKAEVPVEYFKVESVEKASEARIA